MVLAYRGLLWGYPGIAGYYILPSYTYVKDKTIANDPRGLIFLYVVLKAIPNNFAFMKKLKKITLNTIFFIRKHVWFLYFLGKSVFGGKYVFGGKG